MHDEEMQIRAVIDERIAAIRARDARRANAVLAGGITAFELAPPLALEGVAARDDEALDAWLQNWVGPIDIEVRALQVVASGSAGFAYGFNRLHGTQAGGRTVDFWFRSTLGFRKIDGAWKIVHAHSSVPFYMDGTFRAALDLKP
jgi:ketosteroid isomerase-like protein